ncbi:zinc finger protein 585a [Colletotrichum plurivorum]|uniref:Zinc finger protein 585a n=1 Tax=Colletotrichum plurivorum TaxID=2175906 RepID=A0A8H6KFY1_9PEZI|nr:zinc finger protein 585a [Colletotrichum plurivorum]
MEPPSPDFEDLKRDLLLRAQTTEVFNEIWEDQALPHLRSVMKENSLTEYSIAVEFNYDFNHRIVEVTTPKMFPEGAKSAVTEKIDVMFKSATLYVEIQFFQGVDERSSNSAADSDEDCDWDDPTNGTDYLGPPSSDTPTHPGRLLNGDSIDRENGRSAATLGPAIQLDNERIVWLVSGHVFEGVQALNGSDPSLGLPECYLVHPGNLDRRPGREVKRVAKLYAHSGPMCRTQRQSRSIAKFATKVRPEQRWVVTDWALCVPEKDEIRLLNHLRYAPRGREFQDCSGLVDAPFPTNPKLRLVRSSGRSSGIRWSVVCETPAEVKHGDQPPTREWYLEIIKGKNSPLSVDQWNSGGPGMPGDSGAVIVDDETRKFIGIIWGRSRRVDERKPRRAYFTHGCDVFDDIYSRCEDIAKYPRLVDQTDGSMDLPERPSNLPRNYDPRDFSNGDGDRPTLSSTSKRCGASEITKCASRESMAATACGSSDGGVSILGRPDSGYHANAMFEKAADYLIVPQDGV